MFRAQQWMERVKKVHIGEVRAFSTNQFVMRFANPPGVRCESAGGKTAAD